MPQDVIVCGAGIVGVSVALQLQRRGHAVVLVDRQRPGEGTSFGNAGLIQREAVFPHGFPRDIATLRRIAGNRATDVVFHRMAMPGLTSPLLKYWRNSHPRRYAQAVRGHAQLILTCVDEHLDLANAAGATDLLRPIGYLRLFAAAADLERSALEAERAKAEFGVNHVLLDTAALAAAEPSLLVPKAGAIHWTDPLSLDEPYALTMAYVRLFTRLGGVVATGDALSLRRRAGGWSVQTADGPVEAANAVVAMGAASAGLTKSFGYAPPVFGKRGYHRHYALRGNAVLNRPVLDSDNGYLLAPMKAGVRLTTGIEFARPDAPPTPVQLRRVEPIAGALLPLTDPVEATPWMGVRPATADMVPIIGKAPGQEGLWYCFGHAHQGLTLGPASGRLVAELIAGEPPFVDPAPYRPERFN
jgi:D-amino-acid dehydrogenase